MVHPMMSQRYETFGKYSSADMLTQDPLCGEKAGSRNEEYYILPRLQKNIEQKRKLELSTAVWWASVSGLPSQLDEVYIRLRVKNWLFSNKR
jgi:hypothetical protein